jgi:hypothetical protein
MATASRLLLIIDFILVVSQLENWKNIQSQIRFTMEQNSTVCDVHRDV